MESQQAACSRPNCKVAVSVQYPAGGTAGFGVGRAGLARQKSLSLETAHKVS